MYANEKLVYIRPVQSPESAKPIDAIPDWAGSLEVVHVPAFSGIGTQEPRHAIGIQKKLIGEGRPGEIVRNLLLDIWEASRRQEDQPPQESPLFSQADERRMDAEFAANFPARVDYFGNLAALRDLKASDFIVGLLSQTSRPLPKRDLYMLAALSRPEEIHPDVVAMFGAIAEIVPPRVPSIEANVTPPNANGVDANVESGDDGLPD